MTFLRITPLYRFLFLLVFSAALMIIDHRSQLLAPLRTFGSPLNLPFQFVIDLPSAAREWIDTHYQDGSLQRQYAALRARQAALEVRLQRYDALEAENRRLSELLSASRKSGEQALLAEIVDIGLEPYTHRIGLNRGVESGVYPGQAAITPDGVLGQVSGVGVNHSVVTLITDASHALPVQIQRSGLRAIVQGLGAADQVAVPFLPAQTDIRKGDILVTSGLGGGFLAGYKVAEVREIVTDSNAEFLSVHARPFANIEFAKEVLLISNDPPPSPQSNAEGERE